MKEVSKEEFRRALAAMKYFRETIARFENREDCVSYLSGVTGLSAEECGKAYDLYAKMDLSAFAADGKENTGEEK